MALALKRRQAFSEPILTQFPTHRKLTEKRINWIKILHFSTWISWNYAIMVLRPESPAVTAVSPTPDTERTPRTRGEKNIRENSYVDAMASVTHSNVFSCETYFSYFMLARNVPSSVTGNASSSSGRLSSRWEDQHMWQSFSEYIMLCKIFRWLWFI